MAMRVTFQSRAVPLRAAIQDSGAATQRSQQEVATGKRIHNPSDDPLGTRTAMLNRARLAQIAQFVSNIELARSDMNNADGVLGQFSDRIVRAKEIAIQLSTGVHSEAARAAGAIEVDNLLNDMLGLANTTSRGVSVFGGENTLETPFTREGDTITYNGSDSGVRRRISNDVPLVETTFAGSDVFFEGDAGVVQNGIFSVVLELKNALEDNDGEAVGAVMEDLDAEFDKVLAFRADVGGATAQLDGVQARLADSALLIEELQASVEDVDLAAAISELQLRQMALQASLGVTAQLVPLSLMDLIR